MKISKIALQKTFEGIEPFEISLQDSVVVLTGENGSGKSRLLKMLSRYFLSFKPNTQNKEDLLRQYLKIEVKDSNGNAMEEGQLQNVEVINYSHYDAPLLSPRKFSPYVIAKAKENLVQCNLEETARNVLLFLEDLAKGYSKGVGSSDDFNAFKKFAREVFGLELSMDAKGNPQLFGMEIDDAKLSPGQQYLLRMSAALHCNEPSNNAEFILFLDEPETHLHPKALENLIENLIKKFQDGQIWIATHSLELLSIFSYLYPDSIYHLKDKSIKKLGSNSAPLIRGLLGDEFRRSQLHQFIVSPDAFACYKFAAECLTFPEPAEYQQDDPQIEAARTILEDGKHVIVDFGAGQGRFLDGLGMDYPNTLSSVTYYAYDKFDHRAAECKSILNKFSLSEKCYFNNASELNKTLRDHGEADFVFMINVLHEIPPDQWPEVFCCAANFLRVSGHLVIVENEELTYGENPYDIGFLVPVESAMRVIFCKQSDKGEDFCKRHECKKNIIRYNIPKNLLNISAKDVETMVREIHSSALAQIRQVKHQHNDTFKDGIKLAFWTHQYVNASLSLENLKELPSEQ